MTASATQGGHEKILAVSELTQRLIEVSHAWAATTTTTIIDELLVNVGDLAFTPEC